VIHAEIRAVRAWITPPGSTDPPTGSSACQPRSCTPLSCSALDFSADAGGHRFEMGQTIPHAGPITLKMGALALDAVARPGDWFTLVVRQGDGDPTVFANAIFVDR
jgi:hypothetical protein